jgi:hypothetical protein
MAVDIALSFFEFESEPFVRLRERIWLNVFDEASKSGRSFIFTFNHEVSVEFECSDEAIERRLGSASRAEYGKLHSIADLRRLKAAGAFDFPRLPEPRLRIRTDELTPKAAARLIFDHLDERS